MRSVRLIALQYAAWFLLTGCSAQSTQSTPVQNPVTQVTEKHSIELVLIAPLESTKCANAEVKAASASSRNVLAEPDNCPELTTETGCVSALVTHFCFKVSPTKAPTEVGTTHAPTIAIKVDDDKAWLSCPSCTNKSMTRLPVSIPSNMRMGAALVDLGHRLQLIATEMNEKQSVQWTEIVVVGHAIKALGDIASIKKSTFCSVGTPTCDLERSNPLIANRSEL